MGQAELAMGQLFQDVTSTHMPSSTNAASMDAEVADIDGDGDLDVVVAIEFGRNLLLLNDGTGRLSDASNRLPGAVRDSEDIGIADFDADGDLDILLVSEDDAVNELYLNNGNGTFSDGGQRLSVQGISNGLDLGDADGDGDLDVIIGNNGQNFLLLTGPGGNFTNATSRLPSRSDVTQDVEFADVDGDGDLDLIIANEGNDRLLINDGSARFSDETSTRLPPAPLTGVTREADFGDVDGDGDLDLYLADVGSQNHLLTNDGTGVFTDRTGRLPQESLSSFEVDFFDVDRDGDLDIITGELANVPVAYRVYLNDGSGRFSDGTTQIFPPTARGNGLDIEAADFNGDGRADIYLASRFGSDRLLLALAPAGCDLVPGDARYCTVCGPCGDGEGDCDGDDECAAGTSCVDNIGAQFGFRPGIDVCRGASNCSLNPGHGRFCSTCGPCASGQGDCDNDAECAPGTVCQSNVGADFGFGPNIDVCLPPS